MTRKQYNLIKLQMEYLELYSYDVDLEDVNLKDFEEETMIYNLTEYVKNADYETMSNDDLDLITRIKNELDS